MKPEERYPSRRKDRQTRAYVLMAVAAAAVAGLIVFVFSGDDPSGGIEPRQQGTPGDTSAG
ncbi:hypothetical protein [Jiella marina]|uniref:hypothetical protein n=1 Tax=Jiella sp. LLJ827 TaxID=2917712 RepID=UPI0021016A9D|nr:hypothetical protein [Jiella sp. LLJ827]MCQ0990371.1 hypothetical protein [Jiella sp. LLJ827]